MQHGRYIAQKFESGWEVGAIKAFDKKGLHAGKFSVKYKDDPNWWTHSLLREGYGKDKHWVLPGLPTQAAALRQRGRTPAASRRLPGQGQLQVPPTATRPPSFDIQAESGVPSVSSSSQDQQSHHLLKSVIPTHRRVTEQLIKNWAPFKVLHQR